jgi:hypothetical protein
VSVTSDIPLTNIQGPNEDLYPADEDDQRRIVAWVNKRFIEARDARQPHLDRWDKYYRMYRSYVKKRQRGEWRSRVWMPVAFYVIETITPRLVAQLPEFTVYGVGPEDVQAADMMEDLLRWASESSGLYLELVKALKSALIYGTGILKVLYDEKVRYDIKRDQMTTQQTAEVPIGQIDLDGNPITQTVVVGEEPTGEEVVTRTPYMAYQGPVAEAVNIRDFYIDPIADSVESARYVIHRVFRDRAHMEKMFKNGAYKRPPDELWQNFLTSKHPTQETQDLIGLGGTSTSEDRNLYQLLEVWTDDFVVTTSGGNEYAGILLRAQRNPFAHGEKPFVRLIDHLVPHEFWGIGEMEPLEGLQDMLNTIWNSRIDNVKLVMNTMLGAVVDYLVDPKDLEIKPGGIIRVKEGIPVDQVIKPIELGDVTQKSYQEANEIERMTEKVSGVSQYTAGLDSGTGALNRTATGVALISEQGSTRFAHKVKMAELTGFRSLARQFGSLLQQYMPAEMQVRILGPMGQAYYQTVTADSVSGRFDYDIEAESSTQTESLRREQTLSLFQMLAADPYSKPLKIRQDLLKTFGRKDIQDYILTPEELQMLQQQMAGQQAAGPEQGSPQGGGGEPQ